MKLGIVMKLGKKRKLAKPPICPFCNIKCKITKPFLIITQIVRKFDCPECDYGGLRKVGVKKK